MFKIFKSLFKSKPQALPEPEPLYQWIVHHCRSTDRVFFGPFKSYKELDEFFRDPKNNGIHTSIELLISPNCPREQYWYNPHDFLYENYPYLYERLEDAQLQSQ